MIFRNNPRRSDLEVTVILGGKSCQWLLLPCGAQSSHSFLICMSTTSPPPPAPPTPPVSHLFPSSIIFSPPLTSGNKGVQQSPLKLYTIITHTYILQYLNMDSTTHPNIVIDKVFTKLNLHLKYLYLYLYLCILYRNVCLCTTLWQEYVLE